MIPLYEFHAKMESSYNFSIKIGEGGNGRGGQWGLTICFSTNRVPTVWPWIVPIETAKIGVAESGMDMRVPLG
jgi:hypothetical protein